MRQRIVPSLIVVAAALAVALPVMAQAQDPWVGTWRLNVARSKYDPANLAPKSQTIVQTSMAGGGSKIITDGVDAQGRTVHTETTTVFDGKPSTVAGAPDAKTTRVYRRVDARTYEYVQSVGGKPTTTVRTVVAADGKTRTITTTGTNAQGQRVNNVAFYERQ